MVVTMMAAANATDSAPSSWDAVVEAIFSSLEITGKQLELETLLKERSKNDAVGSCIPLLSLLTGLTKSALLLTRQANHHKIFHWACCFNREASFHSYPPAWRRQ
jgi:hypothetical protein